jgi:hypothetical protein
MKNAPYATRCAMPCMEKGMRLLDLSAECYALFVSILHVV